MGLELEVTIRYRGGPRTLIIVQGHLLYLVIQSSRPYFGRILLLNKHCACDVTLSVYPQTTPGKPEKHRTDLTAQLSWQSIGLVFQRAKVVGSILWFDSHRRGQACFSGLPGVDIQGRRNDVKAREADFRERALLN